MILYYRNSFLASIVSMFGCGMALYGIMMIKEGEVGGGLCAILAAVPFLLGGKWISNNKTFNKWWKQVKDANLEPEISKSIGIAIEIYNKNPGKRTLEKIRELNPAAAAQIEKSLSK